MPRLLAAVGLLVVAAAAGRADDFFEARVRPVLADRCVSCHGPAKQKGGLRLDSRAAALRGGESGPAVVPGKPADSRLLQAVRHVGGLEMPPGGTLPERDVAALEKWIAAGAPWPADTIVPKAAAPHWAFQPVRRPAVPAVRDGAWPRAPIDRFVLARLEAANLRPSPEADRFTLIRRATFDLHGVPPTPDEIDAFLADESPDAYDRLIDRLLASPRYGERWGRHWLDVARYADNKGYVFFEDKAYPWAWTYRDYVIAALNADTPYDRFVHEQLAADRLDLDDRRKLAALGFLTVGGHFMGNTHDVVDDRIDVVTRGLMGLTVTCARCHDHKFDPVPTADYYSLYGVFRGSTEPTVPPLVGPPGTSLKDRIYASQLRLREKVMVDFVTAKHRDLVGGARARAGEYLLAADAARRAPPADDFMLIADRGDLNPAMVTRWRVHLDEARKARDPVWRMWFALADLPAADFAKQAPAVTSALRRDRSVNPLVREVFLVPPRSLKEAADRYGKLLAGIDRYPQSEAAGQLRRVLYGPTSPADAPLALDWGFLSLFPDRATQAEYQRLIKDVEQWAAKGPPRAMVLVDADRPFDPRVFDRGHPNRLGDAVPRQAPAVVNPARKPFPTGSGRLDLAREITAPSNPLTARVAVNRIWMHHFGEGIVRTPGDFGTRGDPPTHPELLDHLAAEFVADGWSQKRLHKRIMTSATYRQASRDRPDGVAADPDNRLLWKANRRRLDFEALHDSLIAVSAGLDLTPGGPPVPLMAGGRRRAVFGYVDRLEFPSLLTTFDVPSPAATAPQRTTTTVPPQALFLMNGPFPRTAGKWLADRVTGPPEARVEAMFRAALGRRPTADERALAVGFLAKGSAADLAHGLLMTNEFAFVD